MQIQSLGQKDPLEEEMANHSTILAWEIPWTEEPGGLQSVGYKESDTTELRGDWAAAAQQGQSRLHLESEELSGDPSVAFFVQE